jgi:transcriptional regulator with PAS, ATPase and Fis domain
LDALLAYSWPGDIDELDQALVHATRTATQGVLEESHLPISLRTYPSHIERPVAPDPIDLDQVLERLERMLIERAISLHPRNNTAAAKSLGISRARLLRRMQQWGLGSQPAASPESDEVIFEELDES